MNILITGTSGSGKSAVGKALSERGYKVTESDIDKFNGMSIAYWRDKSSGRGVDMPWPPPENWFIDNDWVWRVEIISRSLASSQTGIKFVCGDARNKQKAFHLFDKIFVLKVNDEALQTRLQSRKDNYFGKSPSEYAWVVAQNKTIVDEVCAAGGVVIDGDQTLAKVVDDIIKHVS